MKRLQILTVVIISLTCAPIRRGPASSFFQAPYDLVIRGGTVIDGTGTAGRIQDVALRDGRIVRLGRIPEADARETIQAAGLVVAPGFIDVHNHSEFPIADPAKRLNEGFIRQGVTTIVGGPDGTMTPEQIQRLSAIYERNGTGTNVAFYVGHNAVRVWVMGRVHRAPTREELESMKQLVREGMELGAVGFSTGLMYEPGMFSRTDELIALARVAAPYHGIYDSHVRNPAHALLESDREAIEIGEKAGIPPKIAHEKGVGLENKGLIRQVIRLIQEARSRGVNVATDQYPYDGAATANLAEIIVIPADLRIRPGFDLAEALGDPALREKLRASSENGIDGGFAWLKATGYSHMRITSSRDYPDLVGRHLSEIARDTNQSGFDLVSRLLLGARNPVGITLGAIDEQDMRELLVQPWNMISSDGTWSDGITPQGHPRSTGTFPRVLGRYVRDLKLLTLPEAIRKMTSFPARYLGLYDRGRIAEEFAADIVIFDPNTISDRSTWYEPQLFAHGVRDVLVNGVPVLRDGRLTGQAPGKPLRHRAEPPAGRPAK